MQGLFKKDVNILSFKLSIGGQVVVCPDSYEISRETVGEFVRNAAGSLVGDVVAVKRVLEVGWKVMSAGDYGRLVEAASPIFVEVNFVGENGEGASCVMRATPGRGRIVAAGGRLWWKDVSCSFVER